MADISGLPPLPKAITQAEVEACHPVDMAPKDHVKAVLLSTAADLLDVLAQPGIFGTLDEDPFRPSLENLFSRLRDGYLAPSPLKSLRENRNRVEERLGPQAPTPPKLRPLEDFEDLYYALTSKIQDVFGTLRTRLVNSFNSPESPVVPAAEISKSHFYEWLLQQYEVLNDAVLIAPLHQAVKQYRENTVRFEMSNRWLSKPLSSAEYEAFIKDIYEAPPYAGVKGLRWDIIGASPAMISALLAENYHITFSVEKTMFGSDHRDVGLPKRKVKNDNSNRHSSADETSVMYATLHRDRESQEVLEAKTNTKQWVKDQCHEYVWEQHNMPDVERQKAIQEQQEEIEWVQQRMIFEAQHQEALEERLQNYAQEQEQGMLEAERLQAIAFESMQQSSQHTAMPTKTYNTSTSVTEVRKKDTQHIPSHNTTPKRATKKSSLMPSLQYSMPAPAKSTRSPSAAINPTSSVGWRAKLQAFGVSLPKHSYVEHKPKAREEVCARSMHSIYHTEQKLQQPSYYIKDRESSWEQPQQSGYLQAQAESTRYSTQNSAGFQQPADDDDDIDYYDLPIHPAPYHSMCSRGSPTPSTYYSKMDNRAEPHAH